MHINYFHPEIGKCSFDEHTFLKWVAEPAPSIVQQEMPALTVKQVNAYSSPRCLWGGSKQCLFALLFEEDFPYG